MKKIIILTKLILLSFSFCFSQSYNAGEIYQENTNLASDLQSIIDSVDETGQYLYDIIIIPNINQGRECVWQSGPLKLRSDLTLLFEPNVLFESFPGAFLLGAKFFDINQADNVKIIGEGAKIKMLIDEYIEGEHRHCINITGSNNVMIKNIILEKSGGDGIYIGKGKTNGLPSSDIIVDNVELEGHARNGISVISVNGLTIQNCLIQNTGQYNYILSPCGRDENENQTGVGLAFCGPFSGIDFEPNNPSDLLQNIVVENCEITGNKRFGIECSFQNLNASSKPVSIKVENNYISSSKSNPDFSTTIGLDFRFLNYQSIRGKMTFNNNIIEKTYVNAIYFYQWALSNVEINFDCLQINNPSFEEYFPEKYKLYIDDRNNQSQRGAIVFRVGRVSSASVIGTYDVGNINFNNVYVANNSSGIDLKFSHYNYVNSFKDVSLKIATNEISRSEIQMRNNGESIDVNYTEEKNIVLGDKLITMVGEYDNTKPSLLFPKSYGKYTFFGKVGDDLKQIFDKIPRTGMSILDSPDMMFYPGDYNDDKKLDFFCKGNGLWRGLFLSVDNGVGFEKAFLSDIDNGGGMDFEERVTSPDAEVYPGDYNGDGKTDLFIKGNVKILHTGEYEPWRSLYISNGTSFIKQFTGKEDNVGGMDYKEQITSPDAEVYPGDYNGDGKTDLFIKGYVKISTGEYERWRALYTSNGTSFTEQFASKEDNGGGMDFEERVTSPDAEVYPGDYNGDGKTDLFIKGNVKILHTGEYEPWRSLYISNGTSFIKQFTGKEDNVGGMDYKEQITSPDAEVYPGDYNGDGKTDLFIKGNVKILSTGEYEPWRILYTSNGTSFTEQFASKEDNGGGMDFEERVTSPDAEVYPGDYNGDEKTDLFIKGYVKILHTGEYESWRSLYFSSGSNFIKKFVGMNSIEECDYYISEESNQNIERSMFNQYNYEREYIKNTVSLFPNPAKENFYIKSNQSIDDVEIWDITGHVVYSSFEKGQKLIDVSSFNSGLYFVKIKTDSDIKTLKLLKE